LRAREVSRVVESVVAASPHAAASLAK
jgi:hypothetical protein